MMSTNDSDFATSCRENDSPSQRTHPKNGETVTRPISDPLSATSPPSGRVGNPVEYAVGHRVAERFEILSKLGRGGFGAVYLATDQVLNRRVAVKQSTILRSFVSGFVKNEARAIASLNHPNIVSIFDLITIADHELLIVMEYLDGETLSKRMRSNPPTLFQVVQIVEHVAAALQHAHQNTLVHSDVKPANVFITTAGTVKLLDFGLAVACLPSGSSQCVGGTPGYMAPEQIRGESHLIDGRTDIWGLGAVFYELATGQRAFMGDSGDSIRLATLRQSVRPPRQLVPEIDEELQRILLKCLEKRMCDRYDSIAAFNDDLRAWKAENPAIESNLVLAKSSVRDFGSANPSSSSLRFSTRGLQPFEVQDSAEYLKLIPGLRDRHGIPASIRFWQRWVESNDAASQSPVGVLYGPSGSGKSSFVRAGLIPVLGRGLLALNIECRPGDLGKRITALIEKQLYDDASRSSLRDVLTRVRIDESGSLRFRKVVIILDQFEVWASSASLDDRREFADALRQCDGVRLRVLLVTRDDYWMGVRELLRWLELPILEGRNVAAIELLEPLHAEHILEMMGRENGLLPKEPVSLQPAQITFLKQSVEELTHRNSVVCIHLVMFARMASLQNWDPGWLRRCGGVVGACSLYFQDVFSDTAHPEHRRVAKAATAILSRLVPDLGESISNRCATKQELSDVLHDQKCRHLLDDALRVLSDDLRFITVTSIESLEPELDQSTERTGEELVPSYRLAHDFLASPIRQWLDRTLSRTYRGRVKARLSQLSDSWSLRQNSTSSFPSYGEFLSLAIRSRLIDRSKKESLYLRASARHHAGRISATFLAMFAFLLMSVIAVFQWSNAKEANRQTLVAEVDLLLDGPVSSVSDHISRLQQFGNDAVTQSRQWINSVNGQRRFRSRLFLQSRTGASFSMLASELEHAESELFPMVRAAAERSTDSLIVLRGVAYRAESPIAASRAAILSLYLGDSEPIKRLFVGSTDATRDQAILLEATHWRAGAEPFVALLNDEEADAQVRYHSALIVGTFPRSELLLRPEVSIDTAALVNSQSAAVHSGGQFLAAHLGQDVAAIAMNPPQGADWKMGPDNIPMVRVPKQSLTVARVGDNVSGSNTWSTDADYWMASVPVSTRLFNEFAATGAILSDGTKVEAVSPVDRNAALAAKTENEPILGITMSQAYEFCNWLSRREGLEPCFTPREVPIRSAKEKDTSPPEIPWSVVDDASGYRLPTRTTYVLAVQAGYRNGVPWEHYVKIGIAGGDYQPPKASEFIRPMFSLAPNRFGLFVNDKLCGAWLCGDRLFSHAGLGMKEYLPGTSQNRKLLDRSIYLVQRSE